MRALEEVYGRAANGPYQLHGLGRFRLESGEELDTLQLAVATFGELDQARSNAILVMTWFSGTHATWRDAYIGRGRALDPDKYFIIVVNQIGNGLSTSPHHDRNTRFPHISIGDDVRAQERLLRAQFGIERLAAVVGASMGAQQAWEWAVRFPEAVERVAAIAGSAQTRPYSHLVATLLSDAVAEGLADDAQFAPFEVAERLQRHADLWGVLGFSPEFWAQREWRLIEPGGWTDAQQFRDAYLRQSFAELDPASLRVMARKWSAADVSRNVDGDLCAALGRVTARVLSLPIGQDRVFPLTDIRPDVELTPGAELCVLDSVFGHYALLGGDPRFLTQVDDHLGELLAR